MPITKFNDYCKKCTKLIPVHFAKTNCPECGTPNPVEPLGFIQETINIIAGLGLFFGLIIIVILMVFIALIYLIIMWIFLK